MAPRMQRTKCVLFVRFLPFYFLPFTTPLHFSKGRGGSFLESDLCWRARRWQQPQTSPVLLLDHVSLKSLEDLCAGDPRSPPESGSLAAQRPAEGTRVWHRPTKDHSSSQGHSDSQVCMHIYNNLGFRVFIIIIIISCSAPAVLVSLARVSSQRQSLYQKPQICPQLFHRHWLGVFFLFPFKKKLKKKRDMI